MASLTTCARKDEEAAKGSSIRTRANLHHGYLPRRGCSRCGDEAFRDPPLVNIAHIEKLNEAHGAKSLQRAFLPSNKSVVAGTSYRLTLFAPCLQKGRKTQ